MKKRLLLSIIFLFLGIIIYFLFDIITKSNNAIMLIRNYVPDACWTLSFFFISINFTKRIVSNDLIVNSIYVFSIGLIFELLQLLKIINGTFDLFDILIYFLATIAASLIEKKWRRKENV